MSRESEYALRKRCKNLLNGDIVREITGLEGVELGKFMKEVREFFPDDALVKCEPQEVKDFIKIWYGWRCAGPDCQVF